MLEIFTEYWPGIELVSSQRQDVLLEILSRALALDTFLPRPILSLIWQISVFFLGILFFCRKRNLGFSYSVFGSILVAASLPFLFLPPLKQCLHYYPWFLFFVGEAFSKNTCKQWLLVFFVGVFWVVQSSQLAAVSMAVALVYGLMQESRNVDNGQSRFGSVAKAVVISLLLGLSFWFIPVFEMPQYEAGARLGPISPELFFVRPRFGPWLNPSPLLFVPATFLATAYFIVAGLLAISITVISLVLGAKGKQARHLGLTLLLLVFVGSLDVILPSSLVEVSPFSFLQRVLPGVGLLAGSFDIYPLLAVPVCLHFLPRLSPRELYCSVGVLCLAVWGNLLVWEACDLMTNGQQVISPLNQSDRPKALSGFMRQLYGDWIIDEKKRKLRSPESLKQVGLEGCSSSVVTGEQVAQVIDGNLKTFWRSAGPQGGQEGLEISCARRQKMGVLEISSGQYKTDFPRGVLLDVYREGEGWLRAFSQSEWYGNLEFNREGFPYLGSQEHVFIYLPEIMEWDKLRVSQVGQHAMFSWTVAELRVFSWDN